MIAKKLVSTKDMPEEEWLKWRKKGIGGSEAATIAGLNPWSSTLKVYIDKINEEAVEHQDNECMRVGRDLEDYVARRFEEATGKKVRKVNYLLQHREHEFMLANLDRDIVGEEAFLECKTTGSYSKSDWEEGVPLHYEIQCLHYMSVTGCTHCYIAVLIGNEKFIWHKIERDEDTINNLIKIEKDFWENNILANVPPSPDGTDQYSEMLKDKYSSSITSTIELKSIFEQKLKRRDELIELIDGMETEKKQIDQEIQVEMEENDRAILGDRVITWKSQNRATVDSKRLKEEQPDIYKAYSKTSTSRPFKVK
jgi:putative phage-type endonuclease